MTERQTPLEAVLLELPAEMRRLIQAWRFLEAAIDPTKAIGYEGRSRSASQWRRPDDPMRAALRTYREARRKEIGRIADDMDRRLREKRKCPKCGEYVSWEDAWCGESKPEGKGCGALLARTSSKKSS